MKRKPYPTDLSDAEWPLIEPLIPPEKPGGHPRTSDMREIVNAIFYLLRAGCAWRLLPHDLPPWPTVYYYLQRWRADGTWQTLNDTLRRDLRRQVGKDPEPSAAITDSQSVKTTEKGGTHGYDAGKQVNGRKRHILVDTLGLLLLVVVTAASVQDRDGARLVLDQVKTALPRLKLIWADAAYAGPLIEWVKTTCSWVLSIVRRDPTTEGFQVQPKRWIVERTFAWFYQFRRLSKDYEYLTTTSEAMIYAAMTCLMVRRLARLRQT